VADLMVARVAQFRHVVDTELPVLFEDFALDAHAQRKLRRYVGDLENWMSGVLNWHRRTIRYGERELLASPTFGRVLHGATGLGTSGVRGPWLRS
jgi:germacradienol/geosmin synthase